MTLTTPTTFDYSTLDAEARIVVQQKTAEIQDRLRDIKGKFIEIGDRLIAVKAQLVHGEWGAWLEAEFDWSQDTAERLMNAAKFAGQIPQFADFGGLFTRTAMAKLGATSTPPTAVQEAVQRAQRGEQINDVMAAQIITAHRPAAVRPSTQGAEPDLDADGQPLVDHINAAVNERLAKQVDRDDEDEDEGFRLGDIVDFRGQRCNVIAVSSSGRISVKTPFGQPLHAIDPEREVVTLIERAPERPAAPRLALVPKVEAVTPPTKPAERPIPVVDELPISESHPVGYAGLYATDEAIGYGKATCASCHETHNAWTAIRAGRWKCGRCGDTTNDDLMEIVGKDEYELDQRRKNQRPTNGKPSAPLAQHLSKSTEWYTPEEYIEAARAVMGAIDLDPASCELANRTVRARRYYTKEEDGLKQEWFGRVFNNPPYGWTEDSESSQAVWSARMIEAWEAGDILEGILLVNAATAQKWFAPLWKYPICFTDHRIRFVAPDGDKDQPPHGSVFVYFGHEAEKFAQVFSQFGVVVTQVYQAVRDE